MSTSYFFLDSSEREVEECLLTKSFLIRSSCLLFYKLISILDVHTNLPSFVNLCLTLRNVGRVRN